MCVPVRTLTSTATTTANHNTPHLHKLVDHFVVGVAPQARLLEAHVPERVGWEGGGGVYCGGAQARSGASPGGQSHSSKVRLCAQLLRPYPQDHPTTPTHPNTSLLPKSLNPWRHAVM